MRLVRNIISLLFVLTMAFSMVACGAPKEMDPQEFGALLERNLDMILDKEPYSFSMSGHIRYYRVYEDVNFTQVNASYDDVIIYYSFYDSIPNADQRYADAYNNFGSDYKKEDGNRFTYFDEPQYACLIYDGINPIEEMYFYGEVFHIGHTIIYVYTNSDSDAARDEVDKACLELGLIEIE